MATVEASAERRVSARIERVYEFLSDYQDKRPRILPSNFTDYEVREGGTGKGTRFHLRMTSPRERTFDMAVDEAGAQEIRERDTASTLTTTWRMTPVGNGDETLVRIQTQWTGASGIKGFFERRFAPAGLRRVYQQMLERLAAEVEGAAPERS